MESKVSLAIKVGGFVVVGVFLGLSLVFGVNNWRTIQPGYEIDVIFDSASGLLLGAPVKLSGVDVGEVLKLSVTRDRASSEVEVRVRIWLPDAISLRADDEVWISILGALGEKYVEILPGPGTDEILSHGDSTLGAGVVSELDFTQRIGSTLDHADSMLLNINSVITERGLIEGLSTALEEAEALSQRLQEMSGKAENLITQSQSLADETSQTLNMFQRWTPFVAIGVLAVPIVMLIGLLL